jgi:hypothetical protein
MPGSPSIQAYEINGSGQIAGSYYDGSSTHGYLFSGGSYTTLNLPGSSRTLASGINISNSGEIVGSYRADERNFGFLAIPEPSTSSPFVA